MTLCESVNDEYIRSVPMWIVHLNNGKTVYQRDDEGNSWLALKEYVEINRLAVEKMYMRFRDHWEAVEPNKPGYFFIKSVLGSFIGYTQEFITSGYLDDDGKVHCVKWIQPELINMEEEVRLPGDGFTAESLITNHL